MFTRVSISLDHHQWIKNFKILGGRLHCYDGKYVCETYCEQLS
jgi:hypothetical protein